MMVVKESEADFVCPDCGAELCLEGGHIESEDDLPCLYCQECGYVGPDVIEGQ